MGRLLKPEVQKHERNLLVVATPFFLTFVVAVVNLSATGQLKNSNMENQESTTVFWTDGQLDE